MNPDKEDKNELIHETSPYLLQHAGNPVHWKAWNTHTLSLAQKENKPLLISIGYAACHWCHVMENETFEDTEAAALMNKYFVCIKVDREERPDVDQVYMAAAQLINGNGGWPLNAFAFPDGKPFFAGTYFPKKRWMEVLNYFAQQYLGNRDALREQANRLANGINEYNFIYTDREEPGFSESELENIDEKLQGQFDLRNGGLASSIKFPMPSVWELVMELFNCKKSNELLQQLELTLYKMANGGIYDQLGGGFARYATDAEWIVPHFEKMLYDNALLISLYSRAYQLTHNEVFKKIAEETIAFVLRELAACKGYCASLDADSEGSEGAFYVWSYDEITDALKENAASFLKSFNVTPGGNFEHGKNILHRTNTASWHEKNIDKSRKKLLEARNHRVRPALDNKVLTSWNAMMSIAFTDAGKAFKNPGYYSKSKDVLDFILSGLLTEGNELFRNFQKGKAATHAFLDDYAFLVKALTNYYQATFDIHYLNQAKSLTEYVLEHFYDQELNKFYYTNKRHHGTFTRPLELTDNVIPSSSAVMAENLVVLGTIFFKDDWEELATRMVKNLKQSMIANPSYFSHWLRVMIKLAKPSFEIAIAGEDCNKLNSELQSHYLPDCIFCGSITESKIPLLEQKFVPGKTLIYVCSNRACQNPTSTVGEAIRLIENLRSQTT